MMDKYKRWDGWEGGGSGGDTPLVEQSLKEDSFTKHSTGRRVSFGFHH